MKSAGLPLILTLLCCVASAAEAQAVRTSAERAVGLLQKVTSEWRTPCLSCHHQTLPMLALESARTHGIRVNETAAKQASERTFRRLLGDFDAAAQVQELIDPALSEGYTLVAAHAAGVTPNLSTAAVARHIARNQRADGSWAALDARPPQSEGLITATAVAARAISVYLPAGLEEEKKRRLSSAARWLSKARPRSTEDLTFRLLGLHWTGETALTNGAAKDLLAAQRADGGWGQLAAMPQSDAYSTGQALYALRITGSVQAGDAHFRKGVDWLAGTQATDGSWHVKSRIQTPVPISPPYFESGFPHGHDQWISCAATAWAVMALAEALPPAPPGRSTKPLPLEGVAPAQSPAWIETALFGTPDELRKVDPNAATANGTTALMLAADHVDKVRVLLQRGAKAKTLAKSGFDALMMASLFPDNLETLRALVAAGLSPKGRENVRFRAHALTIATFTGDTGMIGFLLDQGADPNRPHTLLGQAPFTAAGIAAQMDYGSVIALLKTKGAKMDVPDENGVTDLGMAALAHKNDALRALLAAGANPRVKDKFGLTPLDHTKGILHLSEETRELIERALR